VQESAHVICAAGVEQLLRQRRVCVPETCAGVPGFVEDADEVDHDIDTGCEALQRRRLVYVG
jgi:hypothetical protein